MSALIAFLARLLALAAGLVFAASVALAAVIAAAVLLLRAGWARLTGRPVSGVLGGAWRMGGFRAAARRPGHPFAPQRVRVRADVTDVDPK
ncbi:hypothetical protein PE066_20045 [Ramlibacter tataouinensis]|uniref:hypothetical protein n=1 Tax=Ramlibacter tataouinensis TaxID=94132 RepID=UPI0022F3CC34|nr:hypothetical protein [Ramlibacter tataouinensis]WBY01715.1 hypothetical protein PE066_20045 [Ramlibacter tataouinensis]